MYDTHTDRVKGDEDLGPLEEEIHRVIPPVESQVIQELSPLWILPRHINKHTQRCTHMPRQIKHEAGRSLQPRARRSSTLSTSSSRRVVSRTPAEQRRMMPTAQENADKSPRLWKGLDKVTGSSSAANLFHETHTHLRTCLDIGP